MILDDFDSRPGSATSLLRTIVGSYLRVLGGWLPVTELIRLMDAVGIPASHTRTSIQRVKAKGLLLPESRDGQSGYRLNPEANPMLERGDRRIFNFRQQPNDGAWCLISYSIPESQRALRHQLRKRLIWMGCGSVSTGLWIAPALLTNEVEDVLHELEIRDLSIVFITDTPQMEQSLRDAARGWWDLDLIASYHREFLTRFERSVAPEDPKSALAMYITALDSWRPIAYLDPGLQPNALPEDWPGFESFALFNRLKWELTPLAERFVFGDRHNLGESQHSGGNQGEY